MTKADNVRSLLGYQRIYLGLTREQLSAQSGISVRTIRRYETGERAMGDMGASMLFALCRALGITTDVVRFD